MMETKENEPYTIVEIETASSIMINIKIKKATITEDSILNFQVPIRAQKL